MLSLLLFIPSVLAVFYYTKPMEDASFDLSLSPEDGQEWEGNKGWSVYTNEAGSITELTPDGAGGYEGLEYPGQTFYYSRTLTEELDSPTLQIGTVNQTISVFLDATLLYTDAPDSDNRIGYVELATLEWDRLETITVSLPPEYLGKTLTIAQSSPLYSETQSDTTTVWPCNTRLYCGYAYESGLISATAKTMLPAVLLFALVLFLLVAFVWNASVGKFSLRLPVFALAILLQMCSILSTASFCAKYVGIPPVDLPFMFFQLSIGTLFLFLCLYAGRFFPLYLVFCLLQWSATFLSLATKAKKIVPNEELYITFLYLPQYVGCFALLLTLVSAFFLWKQKNRFFRHMAQSAAALTIGYVIFLFISRLFDPDYCSSVFLRLSGELTENPPNFSLKLLWYLSLLSGLAAVVMELLEQEAERRTELALLSAKNELALESYENLRRQSEEVMILRHDTMKHYALLRTMAEEAPDRLCDYLDELIGQVQNVRPVVDSRNQILNILINGKLNSAVEKGISTEIVRSDAPEQLPLSDAELCCLVVNILDNAINAASASKVEKPYIKLDFHCKNQAFVFSCENSASKENLAGKKASSAKHGYGLKIIRQIMSRWGENMISIETSEHSWQITIVLPQEKK